LGDGEETDEPDNLCTNVVRDLPRCMDMIGAEEVIRRIGTYFASGVNQYLARRQQAAAERAIARSLKGPRFDITINLSSAPAAFERAAKEAQESAVPPMEGRGAILAVTSRDEAVEALACARLMRALGSKLPIDCWASLPFSPRTRTLFDAVQTNIIDCSKQNGVGLPMTRSELRLHALVTTQWREVLMLEPGAFPLTAPDALFKNRAFKNSGTLFVRTGPNRGRRGAWKLCGLPFPKFTISAAHFLIDRTRCWSALALWRWVIDRAYFFHGYVDGDGGAAQFAFARLRHPLAVSRNTGAFCSGEPSTAPQIVERQRRAARRALH
jgi:hypothetical protein